MRSSPTVNPPPPLSALPRILEISRRLAASADLHEILSLIIDALRDVLEAERATVFQCDSKTQELITTVAHGTNEIRVPISSGLAGECARTRHIIRVDDAYADARFNTAIDQRTGFRTRSLLCIPLVDHDGELVGVAQVLNKREGGEAGPFTADDEQVASALAAHAAVALRRGRLIEDRLERRKLEQELEVARLIQQSSFPSEIPQPRGFEIAAWNQPATQTGGDAYDVITASDGSRIILLMADATGHGVGPALSVTQLRSMLRMAVRLGAHVEEIAQHANAQLGQDLPSGRFITAWFGELDAAGGTLRSLSAAQGPLLLARASTGEVSEVDTDLMPLGLGEVLHEGAGQTIDMRPGDVFAVISDGIFEARNASNMDFGIERTIALLRNAVQKRASAQSIIDDIRTAVTEFLGTCPASDDQTTIIVRRME